MSKSENQVPKSENKNESVVTIRENQVPISKNKNEPVITEGFKERTIIKFSFDNVGDKVQGIYGGMNDTPVKDKVVKQAILHQESGDLTFLVTAQLLDFLRDVPTGSEVLIVYTGAQKVAHGNMKTFRVYTK